MAARYDILSLPIHYGQTLLEQIGIKNSNVNDRSSGLAAISPNGYSGLGDGGFIPELDKNDVYQVGGSLSNQRGAHSLKPGAEFRKRNIAMSQSATPRGSFTFNQAQPTCSTRSIETSRAICRFAVARPKPG